MKNFTLQMLLRRLAAFLYDSMLLLAVFFMVTGAAIMLNDGNAIVSPLYKLALIPVAAFFFTWFWLRGGQTLGMRAWHIKVVNSDDKLIDIKQCLIRFASGLMLFGITYLAMPFNKRGNALHDTLSQSEIKLIKPLKKNKLGNSLDAENGDTQE